MATLLGTRMGITKDEESRKMKPKYFSIVLGLCLLLFGCANEITAEEYDFRQTRWGMTEAQVRKAETTKFTLKGRNTLNYIGTVLGKYTVKIQYVHVKNKLVQASYAKYFPSEEKNVKLIVEVYYKFLETLTNIYGSPLEKVEEGNIFLGSKECLWETDRTEIKLYCHNFFGSGSPESSEVIIYTSKKLRPLLDLDRKQVTKKNRNKHKGEF